MHGTLLYPLPGRHPLARPKGPLRGVSHTPKLSRDLGKRIAMWRGLLAKLLRRTGMRAR
jgi:hypothetical protein